MRKLSIDELFSPIKKQIREPLFYYKHYVKYGKIEYIPNPRINVDSAIKAISKLDETASKVASELFNQIGPFDQKNIFHHIEYKNFVFKNYIPSIPLLNVLSKIKVDIPSTNLPDGLRLYFDLGGYKDIQYLLISTYTKPCGGRQLKVSVCEKDIGQDCIYFGVDLTEDTLEESILSMPYSEMVKEGNSYTPKEVEISKKSVDQLLLAANLLIYVSNPNEDFKDQYNQFSKDNKKAQREKLEYTSRPFTPIGEGIEFLRLIREEEVGVMGHFRWQPCGVGRTQRKLTFVKPHVRTYKKFEGEV